MTLAEPHRIREGTKFNPQMKSDLFFVTLEKSEERYSPTTMYKDYAISPVLFHWESQSFTTQASRTGQRYIRHRQQGSHILLFACQGRHAECAVPVPRAGRLRVAQGGASDCVHVAIAAGDAGGLLPGGEGGGGVGLRCARSAVDHTQSDSPRPRMLQGSPGLLSPTGSRRRVRAEPRRSTPSRSHEERCGGAESGVG